MKFHITIKDNKTGEAHLDIDTDGILVAAHENGGVNSMLLTECNSMALFGIYQGAAKQLEKIESDHPLIAALAKEAMRKDSVADSSNKDKGEGGHA